MLQRMYYKFPFWLIKCLFLVSSFCISLSSVANDYSLAINNGRVIDPETSLDAVRHLGIQNGEIVQVSEQPLKAETVIDASDLVVAPGFIDLHTHTPTPLGQYYQLFDGVTTALELEAGHHPVLDYGAQISEMPLINYGASAGYVGMRVQQKNGIIPKAENEIPELLGLKGWLTLFRLIFQDQRSALAKTFTEPNSPEELAALRVVLEESLAKGALGIGLALDYISEAVDSDELAMIFDVAADKRVPIFVHIRRGVNGDPSGLREVLQLAGDKGAAIHICHITHNAIKNIDLFLSEIAQARENGVDVTTELLPFNAGSTFISAAVFNRDWQTIFGITYSDVQWAETGEWFTAETWNRYQKSHPMGKVIHHYLDEQWTRRALIEPGVIIVSDAIPMEAKDKKVPPHNGAFTKILGKYVREEEVLNLSTAIAKMSFLPAKRLEEFAPAFKRKGRIQRGMDADIVIFDPDTVKNNATYQHPYQEATGLVHIFVNGVQLVRDGQLLQEVFPGRRITSNTK